MPAPPKSPIPFGGRLLSSSVAKARERMKQDAEALYLEYRNALKMAVAAGEYEAALKSYQWLQEHIPEDEGVRVIDGSIDKPTQLEGPRGPQIQIGIALDRQSLQAQLPTPEAEVIAIDSHNREE